MGSRNWADDYCIYYPSDYFFQLFICLLAGVGLGMLALRHEREVIIVGTSILGGILSGFSAAKLAKMEEIPFGIIFFHWVRPCGNVDPVCH